MLKGRSAILILVLIFSFSGAICEKTEKLLHCDDERCEQGAFIAGNINAIYTGKGALDSAIRAAYNIVSNTTKIAQDLENEKKGLARDLGLSENASPEEIGNEIRNRIKRIIPKQHTLTITVNHGCNMEGYMQGECSSENRCESRVDSNEADTRCKSETECKAEAALSVNCNSTFEYNIEPPLTQQELDNIQQQLNELITILEPHLKNLYVIFWRIEQLKTQAEQLVNALDQFLDAIDEICIEVSSCVAGEIRTAIEQLRESIDSFGMTVTLSIEITASLEVEGEA